ncbi:YkgJ family cysteine cluster protein [Thiothrix unzii]|uniref:YkgJ family cysteine cluster protein n=1 Tax=Thiothrix unzii TaxID=111769 RepID=A0A975IHN7_9GAMM|nr:YkgJ family cysteine cluster protein [Thiothrix unzii]QTR54097.1 YkgJ family cysteine cluster protein [Thiothrix unzii]
MANPCIECGACCASFRVSFYWGETDAAPDGYVPAHLTQAIAPHHVAMLGTDQARPHCIALQGTVGEHVSCTIYPLRSSTCQEFTASWENGIHNPTCDRARANYGLAPLTPESLHF